MSPRMDGSLALSSRKGGFDQGRGASRVHVFYVMLQITEGTLSSYKQPPSQFLVGKQRRQKTNMLGGMGRNDEA